MNAHPGGDQGAEASPETDASGSTMMSSPSRQRRRSAAARYHFVSIDDSIGDPREARLLSKFYARLMMPAFPLEEERDALEDWMECFECQSKFRRRERRREEERRRREMELGVLADCLRERAELGEEGGGRNIAAEVFEFANGDDKTAHCDEDDADFDGPAMDVVLMIANAETSNIESVSRRPLERSRSSLMRRQESAYGGLYAPTNAAEKNDLDAAEPFPAPIREELESLGKQSGDAGDGDEEEDDDPYKNCVIVGGAAVEYYRQSRVGLLSYIVLHDDFRGRGLAKQMHEEALAKLEALSRRYATPPPLVNPNERLQNPHPSAVHHQPLRAIFAETNTPAAGDVTPEQSLARHVSLHNLGYRLVNFPYAQPPLSTDELNGSFDDIVLLIYFPFHNAAEAESKDAGLVERYCLWFLEQRAGQDGSPIDGVVWLDPNIPFRYVEDFYQSVFGYDDHDKGDAGDGVDEDGVRTVPALPDYRQAYYYRLAHWFTHVHCHGGEASGIEVSLRRPERPWYDCMLELMTEWDRSGSV